MLPNRFHQKECHATTNQQSSKKRSSQGALAGGYMKYLFVKHTIVTEGARGFGVYKKLQNWRKNCPKPQNRQKIRPKPKTPYIVEADTVVTYRVKYTNTNFIKVFFVFMWRHHFPKLQISNPTEVLVSSDIRPY